MNWGLFLGLESFLLPLSLALRVAFAGWTAGEPFRAPVQLMRVILVTFLFAICCGKLPATIYAVSGNFAALGHVTEGFMVSPLGLGQMALITAGVVVCDVAGPGIAARMDASAPAGSAVARSLGIIGVCLLLGWAGQGSRL
ncbi:hypothetical protein [Sphingomonas sp.]|uniref:hypothetical protein n=1 Tax=Sphingomonas sp. TaxID=28214 RepID=UPI003CC6878F